MGGRRLRRFARPQNDSVLPLRSAHRPSATLSCCYCDLKISAFNRPLFRFGRRYARFFQAWFSVGIGFTFSALLGVTMILGIETARVLFQDDGNHKLDDLFSTLLFGFSPTVTGLGISFIDAACLLISTILSVAVHEFGHAVAAARGRRLKNIVFHFLSLYMPLYHVRSIISQTIFMVSYNLQFGRWNALLLTIATIGKIFIGNSEGIPVEYIAIFIAGFFPGALVAFDSDSLLAKPRKTSLRVYCAGIWHNAVFSAGCGLILLLLPFIFSPLYVHGEGPVVIDVSSLSPLSDYLSPGDAIVSLDGINIQDPQEWMQLATLIDKQTRSNSTYAVGIKDSMMMNVPRGYCVPSSVLDKNIKVPFSYSESACPDKFTAFVTAPCHTTSAHLDGNIRTNIQTMTEKIMYCLNALDIVRFKRCDGRETSDDQRTSCMCSEEEVCLSPLQVPGVAWVEIEYKSPYSEECLNYRSNQSASQSSEHGGNCKKSFLYVGNAISMAESLKLTAYQPRFTSGFGASIPHLAERLLMCTFHVSLTLSLLNSLPVYFLDGESILDVGFCYLTFLSPRKRRILLQACLITGTILSCCVFLRNFVFRFW